MTAGFVAWGFFFAAGADLAAFQKVVVASVFGAVGALVVMWLGPVFADLPDFWGISLLCGCVLGLLSARLAGMFSRAAAQQEATVD